MDSANPVTGQQGRPGVPSAPAEVWRGTFALPVAPAVAPPRPPRDRIWFRQTAANLLRAPFTRDTARQVEFALLGLLLAIPGFVFILVAFTVGLGMSLSFAGMLVGVPLLMVALLGARRLGAVHRRLAGRLLGVQVEPPPPVRPLPGAFGRPRAVLTDPAGWRACAYLLLKLLLSVLSVIIVIYLVAWGVPYLTFPIWWEVLHANGVVIHVPGWLMWWKPDPLLVVQSVHSLAVSFALVPAGLAALLYCPWWLKGCNAQDGKLVARLLGPPLGDRVRELEQSRAHAVDDSAARLRRIERDLHDGAQAQMVAVAMKLGLAREKLGGTVTGITEADMERALELVDAAHRGAKEAIIELRDLARGIHPPVLDHGLGTALTTLAARSDVPVEVVIDLPERPSAAIETIAYFCAAELLTNVVKHSGARHATLEVVHVPGLLRVLVSDDGSGGARIEARGGLAGLAERVRTVDGSLQVSSPRGGPTVVTVELPSHA
ncbi:MAG TPA: sensor domain-containing protein [Streptosporangiaceae bacterium]